MNSTEGLLRIAKVVRWIGTGLAWLWALPLPIIIFKSDVSDRWGIAIAAILASAVCYGMGRGLSWILEGFAKPK